MNHNIQLTDNTKNTLNLIATLLLKSFIIGFLFMMLSFVLMFCCKDWAFNIHQNLFAVTRSQLEVIAYCSFGFLKILIFVFFLIPYLAIKSFLHCKCLCKKD
ncbi:MAG: DUF6868 family protein [bacterium]|nr:hypothetical protein [bacterium]MBU1916950.1 hypothetical protein [bacterium]